MYGHHVTGLIQWLSRIFVRGEINTYIYLASLIRCCLFRYVDFINVMAYDYYGSWSHETGYNSPLYDDRPKSTLSQVRNIQELQLLSFFLSKLLTFLMRNYFPKRTSIHRFILCLNYVPVGFVFPPLLSKCIAIFAVTEGWLLLYIG